jgi:fructosamine-3-kinase
MNVQEEALQETIDPYLTEANLSGIATAALGIKTRCHGVQVLTGGCWNRVISAPIDGGDKHLVFKLTLKPGDANLQREFEVLRYFKSRTTLPVPEAYLVDLSGGRLPGSVMVMEKLPGLTFKDAKERLGEKERADVCAEVAEHVADLHVHQEKGFGGVELPAPERASTWPDFWVPRFDKTFLETQEKIPNIDPLLAGIRKIRPLLPALLEIGTLGTLTHFDIWDGNVMVDISLSRPRVSGFVDPTGYYADYARELSSMFGLDGPAFMQTYIQRHGLDETYELRYDIYVLEMRLQLLCMYPADAWRVDLAAQVLSRIQASLEKRS